MSNIVSITFARGARRVTGSNFLLEIKEGTQTRRILVDCGLSQGERFCESVNGLDFSYDPASIDAVFFTHAHADHIGLFPKLVKEGFKGRAYATRATKALVPVMLEDSVKLIQREAERCNDEPPYSGTDVRAAVDMLEEAEYQKPIIVVEGITATFYNAGHILGSALVVFSVGGKKILFTGDLGRTPAILVPDHDVPEGIDYLITESVYGNRVHGTSTGAENVLFRAVEDTVAKKGVLLIPAFSLERTQIILSALDRAIADGTIPSIPVFMDSPLAAKVTDIYRRHPEFLREDARKQLTAGDDPFSFPSLKVSMLEEESEAIEHAPQPKIIIAGAGMSHGGRIRRHEKRYLPHASTTILFVGYQVPASLGRRIVDGAKEVDIDGQKVTVRAQVIKVEGFSAHADQNDLLEFAEKIAPKRAFVVLGETEAATFLAQRIAGFLNIPVDVPREGETYTLE